MKMMNYIFALIHLVSGFFVDQDEWMDEFFSEGEPA